MNPYSYDYNLSDWYGSLPGGAIACYWCLIAVSIAAMWILYNKAHEEGWAAIVPFYNTYVLLSSPGAAAGCFCCCSSRSRTSSSTSSRW